MNIKKLIGYLLLALFIFGMTFGIICIFYLLCNFTLGQSILFTLGIYAAFALLISFELLISNLIFDEDEREQER